MADKKISALTAATTPLAGTEVLPIVQSSATKQVSVANLTTGRDVSVNTLTSTVVTGTAPFTVSSTTQVANLNAATAGTASNLKSNATTGVLQVAGPAAASTRVMTTPDANFTAARTDAAQTFTGDQTVTGSVTAQNTTNTVGQTAYFYLSTYNTNFGQISSATFANTLNNTTTGQNTFYLYNFNHNSGSTSNEIMRVTSGTAGYTYFASPQVGVGVVPFGNVGVFAVKGNSSLTDGSAQGTTTDLVQTTATITTAQTILTNVAPSLSSEAASYIMVYGSNNAGAYFFDVLVCLANAAGVTVLSSTTLGGSPAARTYALSSGALTLAMASGTYNVTVKATALNYPF